VNPVFTVVVPTFGKRGLLERTLNALAVQDLEPDLWNLVVVNDGSPDDTAGFLEQARRVWSERLTVVTPEQNVGRAKARNLGAERADGVWILFLDDDIVAQPDLLSSHRRALKDRPKHGTIGLVQTSPELIDAPHFHYIDTRGAAKVRADVVPARYLVTQNTAVPRDSFLACGGFDEAFQAYGFEDGDLGFRLEREGVIFHPLRHPVPHHVHHHTFAEWVSKKRECGHGPLQLMGASWPDRLSELAVDWIVDPPGTRPSEVRKILRLLARSVLSPVLGLVLPRWPTRPGHVPLLRPLYDQLMNAQVLSAFCQGVADHDSRSIPED